MFSKAFIQPIAGLTCFSGLTLQLASPMFAAGAVDLPALERTQYLAQSNFAAYLLGPGDRINITVFNAEQYGTEATVLPDGTINLPVVGNVQVSGLTPLQAQDLISQLYSPYLQRPIVTLSLTGFRPLQIGVAGEVARPGAYTIAIDAAGRFPTVTQALQEAGGLTQAAATGTIELRREGGVITIDLDALTRYGDLSQDPMLLDGDSIFVPTQQAFDPEAAQTLASTSFSPETIQPTPIAIVGEVIRPGVYTVSADAGNATPPTVTAAIAAAGGTTQSADISRVEVRRNTRAGIQTIDINLVALLELGDLSQDIILQPGDSIVIPTQANYDSEAARDLASASFAPDAAQPIPVVVVGEVSRPGAYTVNGEAGGGSGNVPTATVAIDTAGGITKNADIRTVEVRRTTRTGVQTLEINLWELLQSGDLSQDIILQAGDTIVVPTARDLDPTEIAALSSASFSPDVMQVNIIGEVISPGLVDVPPNTPLNQAILAAGGFDRVRADDDEVQLIRLNPDGTVSKREIKVDLESGIDAENNPVLQSNDVVVVGRSFVTSIADTAGEIIRPIGSFFSFLGFFRTFSGSSSRSSGSTRSR
jgi:polysaccharide biosynthesis/export protein